MNYVTSKLKSALSWKVFAIIMGIILLTLIGNSGIDAQDKHSQQNFQPGIPFAISDIESINATNGNLMFNFGFGGVKGRGTAAQGISLKYNSKLYESHVMTTLDVSGNHSPQSFIRPDLEGGWKYDGDYQLRFINRNAEFDDPVQVGGGCVPPNHAGVFVHKLMVYFPDGSQHEFRPTGYSDSVYNSGGIPVYIGDGFFNVDAQGTINTLIWSTIGPSTQCNGEPAYSTSVVTTYDPNPTHMTYYSTDGTFMRLEIPKGQGPTLNRWTVFMPDGSKVTNGELDAQNNVLPQRVYDKNGNFVTKGQVTLPDSSIVTGYVDQMGRYVAKKQVSQTEDHIYKLGVNGEPVIWKIRWKYTTVIRKYTTSGTSGGIGRCCYSDQVLVAQPKVIDEIEVPGQLGGQKYKFTYDGHDGQVAYNQNPNAPNSSPGWGDLLDVTLPSGAKAVYDYALLIAFGTDEMLPLLGKVKEKRLKYNTSYDGISQPVTETWQYSISQSGTSTITGPDGGLSIQNFYNTNTDNDLSGRVYKETIANGTIVERIWANNKVTGCGQYGCGSMRRLNTYVKTEFTTIPDNAGNPSLTAIKDLEYDKNGNVIKVTEYDWVSYGSLPRDSLGHVSAIPAGATVKRISETSFYNQTEDSSNATANNPNSYWNSTAKNVNNAVKSTVVKQPNETLVTRTEIVYDNADTTANPIEVKTWDSVKGNYSAPLNVSNSISTTTQFDTYGNPTLTTDANGTQTKITYASINGYFGLYPTQTESAFGTAIKRTATATYDFHTGLVLSSTDVDNNLTNATEFDAIGRPMKSKAAVGTPLEAWTETEYNDVLQRVIVRSDIETKGDGKKIAVQHYDELGRVRLSRSIENVATEDPYSENDGIKQQIRYQYVVGGDYALTSNRYRASNSNLAANEPTMGWKVEFEDKNVSLSTSETFAGADLPFPWGNNSNSTGVTKEEEDANATINTDESGKKRRTITDGLGRLIRVDEPDDNNSLGSVSSPIQPTNYSYDTLGNLTQIIHGGQTRTFTYSSQSRLLTATNPESGTFQHTYDNNGNLLTKKDARNVTTTYTYDPLNRVAFRDYSDATPDITYTYDDLQIPFSKGMLTTVSSSVSESKYTAFDQQQRIVASQQSIDGQTYGFGYTYRLNGDLLTQTYPSGKVVKNDYDNDGDLAQVSNNQNQKVYANSFNYSAHRQVNKLRLGNGKWETTKFNSALQITEVGLGHSSNDSGLWKINYDYGEWENGAINAQKNNGNLARQTITVPTIGIATGFTAIQNYGYDKLDRLKSAVETVGGVEKWKQTLVYDRFGNKRFDTANTTLLSTESNVPKVANPEVLPTNNQYKADQDNDGINDYLYDVSGNITTDAQSRTFTYDGENRQTTAVGNNLSVSYAYDGNDKRVKSFKAFTNQTTIFVYDANGDLAAEYAINMPSPTGPTISYLTEDALGSVRIVTNSFGEIKARRDFLPFGEEIYAGIGNRNAAQKYSASGDDTRKKFATYQRDAETGLDYAQARYFSPTQGRFTSPDEFKGGPDELFDFNEDASRNPLFYANLENPQSLNKYQYTYNNPCKYRDPSGHSPEGCWQKIVGAVGGGILGGTVGFLMGAPAGGATGAVVCSAAGPGGTALCGAAGVITGQAVFTLAGMVGGAVGGYTFFPCPKSNSTQSSTADSNTLASGAYGISYSAEHTKRKGSKKRTRKKHQKGEKRKQREQNRPPRKTPKKKRNDRLNPPKRKPGEPRKDKYPTKPRNPNEYNTP